MPLTKMGKSFVACSSMFAIDNLDDEKLYLRYRSMAGTLAIIAEWPSILGIFTADRVGITVDVLNCLWMTYIRR